MVNLCEDGNEPLGSLKTICTETLQIPVFREDNTKFPQKINLWAGIYEDDIVGPIFIEGNLTGELYLNILENVIDPLITLLLENQWLDRRLPGKWIGRKGAVECPARSPDLTQLDFFLRSNLKSVVYTPLPENIQELNNRITHECNRIRAPIRAVPGRSRDGTRCRRCLREIETLPHILGFCPYSEALRNIRHHAVRSMLTEALKEISFTVHQEVQGLATQGSVWRIDIIAIKNNSAYILDPTIRFETHADQPQEVDSEKKRIYEPTIPFYKDKYSLSHIGVIGLMVGARGTIPSFFANKLKTWG
ncbi:hypothetical protein ANN_19756 [Periplaneta americana]|uniref:Reverse transcriptase n=1 Tax=Periplaneta americana TaxID=6978 RepID=A0ABQ8SBF1_PERAM|nr:hypothetical protein ANN_19756 [Periplaneta americana]